MIHKAPKPAEPEAPGAKSLESAFVAPEVRTSRLGERFWSLFVANGVSAIGDGLVLVAFPLLAVSKTSNPLLIAGVAVAGRLPALLMSIPAGALADRLDRRRLAALINAAEAVVLAVFAALVLSGHDSLLALYAAAFLLGAGESAFDLTAQTALPGLIPASELERANGYLLAADFSGEQFTGPAIGGVLFAASRSIPFIGDAVSFVVSGVLARVALPVRRPTAVPARASLRAEIGEGLRWFRSHRLLRQLAVAVAIMAFCQAMVLAEMVLYGTHDLRLSQAGYGLAFAIFSSGNILGSLVASRLHDRLGDFRSIVVASVFAGIPYVAVALTKTVAVAVLAMFVEAVAVAVGNVTTLSLRQRLIPPNLLGRVGSLFRTLIFGSIPLGALVGGAVAAATTVRWAFALAGALQLGALVVVLPLLRRRLREVEVESPKVGSAIEG